MNISDTVRDFVPKHNTYALPFQDHKKEERNWKLIIQFANKLSIVFY